MQIVDDRDRIVLNVLIDWGCRRQTKAAISTTEAETNATQDCWTKSLLPAAGTFEQLLKKKIRMVHDTDSEASLAAIRKGVNIALRYVRKSQGLSIAALHDIARDIDMRIIKSAENEPDILTKPLGRQVFEKHRAGLNVIKADESRQNAALWVFRHLSGNEDVRSHAERFEWSELFQKQVRD